MLPYGVDEQHDHGQQGVKFLHMAKAGQVEAKAEDVPVQALRLLGGEVQEPEVLPEGLPALLAEQDVLHLVCRHQEKYQWKCAMSS